MKCNITYFYLQLKMLFRHLPKIIAGTIVLAILASTIAFCGTKILYQNSSTDKITIAIVIEDDSSLMQLGLNYLQSSESIDTFCELAIVSREEANAMLESNRAAACIFFPEHFSDDIVSGENTPATITFSSKTGIEQLLFEELSQAASRILSYAQASIYTIADLYQNYSFRSRKGIHYDAINEQTLKTAFIRSQLFEVKEITSTDELSVTTYYTATGILLLLFLSCMACGSFLLPEHGALADILSRQRIPAFARAFWKLLALTLFFTLLWSLFGCAAACMGLVPLRMLLYLPVLSLLAASQTLFLYTIAHNLLGGTILTFLATLLCALGSGALIPLPFLPEILSRTGTLLPTYYAHQLLGTLLQTKKSAPVLLPLCAYCALFFGLTCIIRSARQRHRA